MKKIFIAALIIFAASTAFTPLPLPSSSHNKITTDSIPARKDSAHFIKNKNHKKYIDTSSRKPNNQPSPVINTPATTNPPINSKPPEQ